MSIKNSKAILISSSAALGDTIARQMALEMASPSDLIRCYKVTDAFGLIFGSHRSDLILLDIAIPENRTFSVLSKLREHAPLASVVLLLPEPGLESFAIEALDHGAHDYLLLEECSGRVFNRLFRNALERKKFQEEVRERKEFSRLISQNVADLILVLDRDGRRVYHSPSYKRILGDLEKYKGSTIFNEIHPDDRESVQRVLREAMSSGQERRFEFRFLLPGGDVRFIESEANVIKDRWGKPYKMVVVSRDITKRKRAEDALRESEQRYKTLLDSTTDYIFTVAVENGRSTSTTHGPGCEALTGYTQDDFDQNQHLWISMVPPEDQPTVLAMVKQLMRGETPIPIEHRLIHKDGSLRWIRNTSVPCKDEQGRLVAYDGLISDITERKMAEERLKDACNSLARNDEALRKTLEDLNMSHQALKATQMQLIQAEKFESIGTLAAGVAHEVKNPLQTMLMGLDYLVNNLPKDNEILQMVITDMRDAVKRANTIVRDLLTFSSSTHVEIKPEDFNLVIERSLRLVNYQINQSRIHIVKSLTPLPRVRMDLTRIEQVFLNLLINAIQAMPQGGTLHVRSYLVVWSDPSPLSNVPSRIFKPGDMVVAAEVQDTGIGIAEKNLTKIFDPFFTTKPVGSGSGLGLSVVKQIIDLHGGHIRITNAQGGGVLATVLLKAEQT